MSASVATTFILIVLARISDMTLDTIRLAAVVQGRRMFAAVLGFLEAVIYVCAVAKVLLNMDHPVYALAYGLGFAAGTYLGIAIEQRLAFGHQLASLFTRKGVEMVQALRAAGYRFVEVHGHAQDGNLTILYVEIQRRQAQKLICDASVIDGTCFCVINDVRMSGFVMRHGRSADPTHPVGKPLYESFDKPAPYERGIPKSAA